VESKTKKLTSIGRSSDFLHLKLHGCKFRSCNWLVICYIANSSGKARFGWTISRRVGNSVIRNKLKRWCREYFRNFLRDTDVVSGLDVNVVFRPISKDHYKNLSRKELEENLEKFCKRILSKPFILN
jgi:ribonuclease P protein component